MHLDLLSIPQSCYIEYVSSIFSSTILSSIYGRVACSTVCTYVFVCCYSSRLVVLVYVPSISSIVLQANFIEECTCSPSGRMFFYLVTWGWNFTSAYVIIHSINVRRRVERRHVNREEFRE